MRRWIIAALLVGSLCGPALGQDFPTYCAARTAVTLPLDSGDCQLIAQDGVVKKFTGDLVALAGSVRAGTTQTITADQWLKSDIFVTTTTGQTLTLPAVSGLAPNGGIIVKTIGQTVTLAPNGSDAINGGSAGVSLVIPADTIALVNHGGTNALTVAPSVDNRNASNLNSGTVAAARGGAGTINGALKGNGSGVVSQAASTDLSDTSGLSRLATNQSWTAGQAVTPTNGGNTGAATVTPDAATSNEWTYVLTGNIILANPTNTKAGQFLTFSLLQDGTGSRTIALGSQYKFVGGTAPTWSTGASKEDILTCWARSTTILACSALIDVR